MGIATIIGAGMMGSAMSRPAADRGWQVRLVGTPLDEKIIDSVKANGYHPTLRTQMPEGVKAYQFAELDQALDGCELVICGVSSFGIDWYTENVLPRLAKGMTMISITKGMELGDNGELVPFPEKWKSIRPDMHFVAVGGPCICFELMARRHTLVHYVSAEPGVAEHVAGMIGTDYYHLLPCTDVIAVECCVAMKNAYALGVSLAVGMAEREKGITDAADMIGMATTGAPDRNPVFNPQAALFAQSCIEIRRLVRLLGGDGDFAGAVPGAGDLYVTVFGGRTRRLGTMLGRGIPFAEVMKLMNGVTLEAVSIITRAAAAIRIRAERGEADASKFPLLMHMDAIINKGAKVDPPWSQFGR